jgi:hypothetical protein
MLSWVSMKDKPIYAEVHVPKEIIAKRIQEITSGEKV